MFGLPSGGFALPNMGEMVKEVGDFKDKFERLVSAVENNNRKLDLILSHLQIKQDDAPVIDAEFTED